MLCYSVQILHEKVLEHLVWSNTSGFQFLGPLLRTTLFVSTVRPSQQTHEKSPEGGGSVLPCLTKPPESIRRRLTPKFRGWSVRNIFFAEWSRVVLHRRALLLKIFSEVFRDCQRFAEWHFLFRAS